jgi:hypothetical protein
LDSPVGFNFASVFFTRLFKQAGDFDLKLCCVGIAVILGTLRSRERRALIA